MREYRATVGVTDGSIMAAIITTQAARNQPSVPRPVHGPSSMPCIRSPVHSQPRAARAKSTTTSPSRERAAAKAGPAPAVGRSGAAAIKASGRPGEPGLRQPGLALVLDPERVDPGALRLGHGEIGAGGVKHPAESN